jgi:hypothetical protein
VQRWFEIMVRSIFTEPPFGPISTSQLGWSNLSPIAAFCSTTMEFRAPLRKECGNENKKWVGKDDPFEGGQTPFRVVSRSSNWIVKIVRYGCGVEKTER